MSSGTAPSPSGFRWIRRSRVVALIGLLVVSGALWWSCQQQPAMLSDGENAVGSADQETPPVSTAAAKPAADSPAEEAIQPVVAEALELADRLLVQFPNDVRALDIAANVRSRLGKTAAAIELWEECLALDASSLEARLSLGTIYFESGEFAKAEAVLRPAAAQSPASAQAAFLLASSLLNQGKATDTVQVLENAAADGSPTVANQVLLGQAYLQLKQNPKARERFLAAIHGAPEYANAYFGLATACSRLGQKDEAQQYRAKFRELQAQQLREGIDQSKSYDDLKSTQQNVAEAYVAAGRLFSASGDDRTAEQLWARAAEVDSTNMDSRVELTQLYQRQNRPHDAVRVLTELAQIRADDPGIWLHLAQLQIQLQEFDAAEKALRRVVELSPQHSAGYAGLADLWLRSQRSPAEAVKFAQQAATLESTAPNYFLWGVASQRAGDREAAAAAIEKALQLDPGNVRYQQVYLSIREKK